LIVDVRTDVRTDGRTYVRTDGRTDIFAGFIRSSRRRWPKNAYKEPTLLNVKEQLIDHMFKCTDRSR